MANAYSFNSSIASGRTKLMDITLPSSIALSLIALSCGGSAPTWEIFFDKNVNSLAIPAQPALVAATTGGTILRSTPVYVRITAIDSLGREGPGSDNLKFVTTGSGTDTNKVTATITAVASAASYNVYVSTVQGNESFAGNTATTTFVITSIPDPALTPRITTDQDINVVGHASVLQALPISGALVVYSRIIVWVTVAATSTPYVSIIGA